MPVWKAVQLALDVCMGAGEEGIDGCGTTLGLSHRYAGWLLARLEDVGVRV
jgi:hypothetical protein